MDEDSNAVSLLWAAPFLIFMVFPITTAFAYGATRPLGIALLAATTTFIAVYVASWIVNPTPATTTSLTWTLLATSLAMLACEIIMAVLCVLMGTTGGAFMASYLAAAWTLQATSRALYPGFGLILFITLAEIVLTPGETSFALVPPVMTALVCLMSRLSILSDRRERVEHQRALALSEERERTRISADLHDILGQTLTALTVKADLAGRLLDAGRPEAARIQIDELTELSRSALGDVRAVVAANKTLLPSSEIDAARALLEADDAQLVVLHEGDPAPGAPSTLVAHVIREATTNALAHAAPHTVWIELRADGVSVTNDGYSPARSRATVGGGSGLTGLRTRVSQAGTITWGPAEGQSSHGRLDGDRPGGSRSGHERSAPGRWIVDLHLAP